MKSQIGREDIERGPQRRASRFYGVASQALSVKWQVAGPELMSKHVLGNAMPSPHGPNAPHRDTLEIVYSSCDQSGPTRLSMVSPRSPCYR